MMSHHYRRNEGLGNRRKSHAFPIFIREAEEANNVRRLSNAISGQRRYSTVLNFIYHMD